MTTNIINVVPNQDTERKCKCGFFYRLSAILKDGRTLYYFCPRCDVPEQKQTV